MALTKVTGQVINNSTGSATKHTYLSYDVSGSYFDLDMSLLQPGYMYGIRLAYYTSNNWREQEEVFKFRAKTFNNLEDYLDFCVKEPID